MKKIIACALLLIVTISFTSCAVSSKKTENDSHESGKTVIELAMTQDYDTTDPFVNEKLFVVSADMEVLEADASCQMDGESGVLEIRDNETRQILWTKAWDASVDNDTFTISLNHIEKDKEYVVCFTGTKINSANIKLTLDSSFIQERSKSLLPDITPLFNNTSGNFFQELTVSNTDMITAELDVLLDSGEAPFLVIAATEDIDATVHYTYTTEDDGVTWGYYLEGSDEKTSFSLRSGTENGYRQHWTEATVTLKQGVNVFYISGEDASCKMYFTVPEVDQTKIYHVGITMPEEEN